ncbi:hypothetical protein JCM3766R1_002988 [Sporobolomyces carnicolor]
MSPTVAQHPPSQQYYGGGGGASLDGLLNKVSIGPVKDEHLAGGAGSRAGQRPNPSGMSQPIPSSASNTANDSGYGMSISPGAQSYLSNASSVPPQRSQSQWQREFPPPLAPRNWTVLKEVGDGSFGTVWLADWHSTLNLPPGTQPPGPSSRPEYKGKQLVAIKRMKKAFDGGWDECMKLKELKSLRQIPMHPNIIPLYDAFLLPTTRELYFVFECMEGNLYQLTKSRKGRPLASGLVASIFYQILTGLDHIHSYGYFHRDMKPENLLITTTGLADYPASSLFAPPNTPPEKDVVVVLKLADFGLAREITSKPPYTEYVSTRWYRAPEVLLRSRDYSVPVDMWALGTILVEVLTLKPLFPGDSEVDQVYKICEVLGDPSTEYGVDERGRVKGGGNWVRGLKMAKDVGFAFPKIAPRTFASLFDPNVVPPQLIDCIQDLLRYEPKARLTTRQCLEHAYFREVAYRFAPYSPEQLRQRQQQQQTKAASMYSANGSSLSVNTNGLSSMGAPSQASPRSIPPSHSHSQGTAPQPQFNGHPPHQSGSSMQRSFSISSTLSAASALSSTYPVHVHPSSPSPASPGFPEGVSDARSINSFSPSAHFPNPMWSGENGWSGNDGSSMRIPSFGGPARRPSIAPSIAASTFYDGSIFEGIAPTRASSIMSFPVNYGNGDGASIYHSGDSPQLNRVDSIVSVNPSVAEPSASTSNHRPANAESSLPSSMSIKSGKWGFFGGDKSSNSSTPTFPHSPSLQASSSTSLNPLKRSPSNNSIAATSAAQASPQVSLDPKKLKKEAEKLAKEQEKANRLAKEQAARERARAVMKKKSQLQEAADPLHNFSNHARGAPAGAVPVDKGKGRAVMSDRMVQQRMPQIIEDTSKLYLSPSAARSTAGQSVGASSIKSSGGGAGDYPAFLSARFKARRRDDDDDVHSVSSTDTGQSSQFGGPSGLFPARGRPFSISSKATSSSDPERRSRNELAEIDLHLNRAGSVASLPLSNRHHYPYHAPSTGHSSLDSTLINNMQGLATGSTTDLSWTPSPNATGAASSANRSDSLSRQRVASPPHHEQRFSPYQVPTSPSHARSPGPTLAPIQFDPNTQYSPAGHARLHNGPSPSGHPALSSSASIASYHSTPSVLPSYFKNADSSRQLPYLPSMDHDPTSPGLGSTFPFPRANAAASPSPNSASVSPVEALHPQP